ncbi:MAG: amino acid permease [Clostridiales bacterium]|nr:amino acid permease [Clostridiales bacterium]
MSDQPLQENKLQRKIGSRQMNMIAIGGAIGTGLFLALGASISEAGPGGTMFAYALVGIAVFFMMNALGEMATHLPVAGAFETFGSKYVDKSFGFMMGWNYWFCCAMTVSVELVAAAILIKFWLPESNSIVIAIVCLALLLLMNLLSAKIFAESEFWFAGIKFVTIIIFLFVGVLMIIGLLGDHQAGFQNWTLDEAPFVGGGWATFSILMVAGFSFIGVEATTVAAGECVEPGKNVPRAINNVFWRIILFYIGGIFVVSTLVSYTDPNLLTADIDNVATSPFTLVFQGAGLASAAHVMNAVILTSVLSCANSTMYIASRLVYSMAQDKRAPKAFGLTSKRGVPVWGVIMTAAVACISFLASPNGDSVVYTWLYNATGLTGFITWLGICISHLRFRGAFKSQGKSLNELQFKAKLYPAGTIIALAICIFVIMGQAYWSVSSEGIDWYGMLVAFVGLPIAIVLWLVYKYKNKVKMIPLKDIDLAGGSVEKEEAE